MRTKLHGGAGRHGNHIKNPSSSRHPYPQQFIPLPTTTHTDTDTHKHSLTLFHVHLKLFQPKHTHSPELQVRTDGYKGLLSLRGFVQNQHRWDTLSKWSSVDRQALNESPRNRQLKKRILQGLFPHSQLLF